MAGFCYLETVLFEPDSTNPDSIREQTALAYSADNQYTSVVKWHYKFRIKGHNGISTSISQASP